MGTVRVTQGLMVHRSLTNLNRQMKEILNLQERMVSGQKINSPSDGALDARRAINARSAINENRQYMVNISSTSPHLTESSSSIENILDSLHRARELTLQASNDTYAQPQLDQIAIELDQILEGVLSQANHVTNGRFVFAGTRTMAPPFVETRDAAGDITGVAYAGNDEHIQISISEGVNVDINQTGSEVFFVTQDIFQMLIDVRDNMRSGDQNSLRDLRLDEFDVALDQTLLSLARLGATQSRTERVSVDLDEFIIQLQRVKSDALDADYADTVLRLNAEGNAFEAALNAAARVIQPSLLDFVR